MSGLFSLKLYLPSWGHIVWPKLMSFTPFCPSSNISLELCSGMFNHTQCSGCSSVWSLRITTALGNVLHCVSTVVHYKLRITTVLACLCGHILSTDPSGVSLRVGVALLQCHPHRRSNSTQSKGSTSNRRCPPLPTFLSLTLRQYGKLTSQEQQHGLNNKLCLFCGTVRVTLWQGHSCSQRYSRRYSGRVSW